MKKLIIYMILQFLVLSVNSQTYNAIVINENGNKKAMCVKMWRKGDFDKLIEFVRTKGFDKFITIEMC